MSVQKVLVTGGAGFIGTHLTKALHDRGHNVTGLDRHPNQINYATDLLIPGAFAEGLERHKPDVVVHLAAQVGRLFGEDDVRHTIRSNVEMTAAVATACAKAGTRLMFASTSEVYGDRGSITCREGDPLTVAPHNAYGLSKRQAEEFCRLYMPKEALTIMRFSMPYGPGAPPGRGRRAMDTMIWQAHHRMPITVHTGAERSWCHISDTVAGIVQLLEDRREGAWNIGRDDDPRSMLWLASEACILADAPTSLIQLVDPPVRQTVVKRLSTEKLRSIGWLPRVELEEGLREMYEWVRGFDDQGRRVPERQAA